MSNLISVEDIYPNCIDDWIKDIHDYSQIDFVTQAPKVCLMFSEPSTRTLLSFETVANSMGIQIHRFPDSSSLEKGESFSDTLWTLRNLGFDVVVIRCSFSLKGYLEKYSVPDDLTIINAGDIDEHPTQALGDFITIEGCLPPNRKSRIVFVGDVEHSRVYRSLRPLLEQYGHNVAVGQRSFDSLDDAVSWADFTYMIRPQKERWSLAVAYSWENFGTFRKEHLSDTYLMHPGPVDDSVDPEAVYAKGSLISKQVENASNARRGVFHHVF